MSEYRYAIFNGQRQVDIRTAPIPTAEPNGVVVKITYCGICGSDTSTWKDPQEGYESTFGHEWTGTIHEVGEGVEDFAVGDRVSSSVGPACGTCELCISGHPNFCQTALLDGYCANDFTKIHGGYAEYLSVPTRRVQHVPEGVTDIQAGLVEPCSVSFHGVSRAPFALGSVVVVQGAGPIGLFGAEHARNAGAGHLLIIEPNESRRQLARDLGFTEVFAPGEEFHSRLNELTRGIGADVVFEATGVPKLVQGAAEMTRRGGTLGLLGFSFIETPINYADWQTRELEVKSSILYSHADIRTVMEYMAAGKVQPEKYHSGTIGLDELQATLEDLASGESAHVKVLVDPTK